MYKDYYHLKTEPFGTHPDPGVIFISSTHQQAWHYLLFSIRSHEPFLLLTGEYGMGKTLLCLRLVQVLSKRGLPAVEYIETPGQGYGGILQRMASRLGIAVHSEDVTVLQNDIYAYFRTSSGNPRFYLIIDDAQEVDQPTLIRLKQLATFNHNGFFPIGIIFAAHPLFLEELKTPALMSLNQRIKRRFHLSRFNFDETKNYIYFRLLKSGAAGIPAFPEASLQKIFTDSGGIPRLINNICDTCLLMGATQELSSIPLTVVGTAVAMVEGSLSKDDPEVHPISETPDPVEASDPVSQDELPGPDIEQDSPPSALLDMHSDPPKNSEGKTGGTVRKLRNAAAIAATALVLMLLGAAVFQYFLRDGRISIGFLSDQSSGNPPRVSKHPIHPSGDSQSVQTIPEKTPPQPEIPVQPAPPLETGMSAPLPHAAPPPSAEEGNAPQQADSPSLHPYSLRASSYRQPGQAENELAELRRMGLTPYLVKIHPGDPVSWWRVYIGWYISDEAAEKHKQLHGLSNMTVQRTAFACQVGEFSTETQMMEMMDRLKQSDYFPYVIQKGKDRLRLYIGAYEKKSEAEIQLMELLKKGFICQVVKR